MNPKGQAFDTFQLLIAAVVALAILVLLMNIIGGITLFGNQKPNEAAKNLVASQVNSPGELRTSNKLTFSKEDSLNAKTIASTSGVVTEQQLCLSLGDHGTGDTTNFTVSGANNNVIRYNGASQLNVKISVLCDTGSELANDLTDNGIQEDWLGGCSDLPQNQTACVVALRYA